MELSQLFTVKLDCENIQINKLINEMGQLKESPE